MYLHKKPIVLIRFSSRINGNCQAIANHILEYYGAEQVQSYTVNSTVTDPCGNCDYECLKPNVTCPNISTQQSAIMEAISNASLAYFIIPNYCGYPCANYFAFNEKSVGYFNMDRASMQKYMRVPKRFIIVSNSESKTFVEAMRQQTDVDPDILYLKTGKYQKRSIAGDLMESDEAQADLDEFLDQPAGHVI